MIVWVFMGRRVEWVGIGGRTQVSGFPSPSGTQKQKAKSTKNGRRSIPTERSHFSCYLHALATRLSYC